MFLTKQRILLRTFLKEIDMGISSLETVVSLVEIQNKYRGELNITEGDNYWYQREMRKNAYFLSGPVTVINFDYLEN